MKVCDALTGIITAVGRYSGLLSRHLSLRSIFIEGTYESILIEFSYLKQIYSGFE